MDAPNRTSWPHLPYVLKGIMRSQEAAPRRRLPISPDILSKLLGAWSSDCYESRMLWAAACVGFFGFMRSGEFTCQSSSGEPPILSSAVAVDSHSSPSMVKIFLRKAKTDPFGKGIDIFLGRNDAPLYPVSAVLRYLAVRSKTIGPLFIWEDLSPLTRDQFVRKVKQALQSVGIDASYYSGHSFRIGAATAAARAGVPADTIKMLGRWESDAYRLYIRTPRETLASISRTIV